LPVSFVVLYFGDTHSLWFSFRGALHLRTTSSPAEEALESVAPPAHPAAARSSARPIEVASAHPLARVLPPDHADVLKHARSPECMSHGQSGPRQASRSIPLRRPLPLSTWLPAFPTAPPGHEPV